MYPQEPERDFIKRVIGRRARRSRCRDRQVYVDGQLLDDAVSPASCRRPRPGNACRSTSGDNYGPFTVPEDHVFVMGDNRDNCQDCRFWGFLPVSDMKGKALMIYWS